MKRVYEVNINPDPWKKEGGDSLQVQFDRADRKQLWQAVRPYVKPTDTILDFAVGGGREIRALREDGYTNTVDVCDYFQDVLDFITSKDLNINKAFTIDARERFTIPFYDTIFCFELIEHLDHPLEFIQRLRTHCYTLLVTCPNGSHMAHPQHVWEIKPQDLKLPQSTVKLISVGSTDDHILGIYVQ